MLLSKYSEVVFNADNDPAI